MERFIVQAPDHLLDKPCQKVTDYSHAQIIAKKMMEIAYKIRSNIYKYPRGFEMAAPQIGELHKIIILQGGYHLNPKEIETIVMVNPRILEEFESFYNWEDCLSVKDMRGYVKRSSKIKVKYQTIKGEDCVKEFFGNIACDIQHGIDHLNGKLYFGRDMKYFIPLSIYRPLKDQSLEDLNDYVFKHYKLFDAHQDFSPTQMKENKLIHPRQCLLL